MDAATDQSLPLDRFEAFNQHLVALAESGVAIDLGPEAPEPSVALQQFRERIALRVSLGQTVEQALAEDAELPGVYRNAATMALRADSAVDALDAIAQQAGVRQVVRRSVGRSLAIPTLIALLAIGALVLLCVQAAPVFGAIYEQLERRPNFLTRLLLGLRDWLPVWGPLAPVVVLVGAWLAWRTDWLRRLRWTPAVRRLSAERGWASLVGHLALLSRNQMPLRRAAPLAVEQSDALGWQGDEEVFVLAVEARNQSSSNESPSNEKADDPPGLLPALLQWSLTHSGNEGEQAENLRFTADAYCRRARRRSTYWRTTGPMVISTLLAGAVLLIYGVAVFSPFATLMSDVASTTAMPEYQPSAVVQAEDASR